MKTCYTANHNKGAALVFALLLLLVATILGVAGMQVSQMDEHIAANQRMITDAFMAAETGAVQAITCLADNPDEWGDESGACASLGGSEARYGLSWNIAGIDFEGDVAAIRSRGSVGHAGTWREILTHVSQSSGGSNLPLGDAIASRQNLQTDGDVHFYGSIHANGDIQSAGSSNSIDGNDGSGASTISTSKDTIELEGAIGDMQVNQPERDIPRPTELLAEMDTNSRNSPNEYYSGDCDLMLSGDQAGKLIFCDGNVTIVGGPFWNVTVAAGNGSIEHSGESTAFHPDTDARVEPPAFVATGNIYIWGVDGNNFSRIDGIYWSGVISGNVIIESKYATRDFELWGNVRADNFQSKTVGDLSIYPLEGTGNPHLGAGPGTTTGIQLLGWSEVIRG